MNLDTLKNKIPGGLKGKPYHLGRRPALDWVVAIGIFFVLTVFGVFFTITNRPGIPLPEEGDSASSMSLSLTRLERVLSHYEAKQNEFSSLLRSAPNLVDPSL